MKYEKPVLVEISKLAETFGADTLSPDCANGSVVHDVCPGGPAVTPSCVAGGIPTASKG